MIIPAPAPPHTLPWPLPVFKLQIDDLAHEGASVFLDNVSPKGALEIAVRASYRWLYSEENKFPPPKVTQITLILRSMPGVAHTLSTSDSSVKEIHFSLEYIAHSKARAREEIHGVLVHEVVHCYQYNGKGACPGGLVEGVADFVRLKASYAPPHWKRRGEGHEWDAGYDTTGYFLSWLEDTYGAGTVSKLNWCMKDAKYHKRVWRQVTGGASVRKLWKAYCALVKDEEGAGPVRVLEILGEEDSDDE